jgi:hypothetical protein
VGDGSPRKGRLGAGSRISGMSGKVSGAARPGVEGSRPIGEGGDRSRIEGVVEGSTTVAGGAGSRWAICGGVAGVQAGGPGGPGVSPGLPAKGFGLNGSMGARDGGTNECRGFGGFKTNGGGGGGGGGSGESGVVGLTSGAGTVGLTSGAGVVGLTNGAGVVGLTSGAGVVGLTGVAGVVGLTGVAGVAGTGCAISLS